MGDVYDAAPPLLVMILLPEEGGFSIQREATMPPATLQKLREFQMYRHALGQLLPPDEVAEVFLRERPEVAGATILVKKFRLDPKSARITSTASRYGYKR